MLKTLLVGIGGKLFVYFLTMFNENKDSHKQGGKDETKMQLDEIKIEKK